MAEFNPEVKQLGDSYLGYSRGGEPNRAFETLFEGVGNLVAGGAKVTDDAIQGNIRKEATQALDQANDAFGLGVDPTQIGAPGQELPADIMDAKERLESRKRAYGSGKLKESHYYAMLEANVKSLRARYPGYREQIDAIVGDVTGVTPANALRRQLMSEIESENSSNAQGKLNMENLVKENMNVLSPVLHDRWVSGDRSPELVAEIQKDIAATKRDEHTAAQKRLLLGDRIQRKQVVGDEAQSYFTGEADRVVSRVMNEGFRVGGVNFQQFVQRAQQAGSDGNISEEELQPLLTALTEAEVTIGTEIDTLMSTPRGEWGDQSGNQLIPDKTAREAIKSGALERISVLRNILTNGDTGLLVLNKALNQVTIEGTLNNVLKNNPEVRIAAVAGRIDPAGVLSSVLIQNPEFMDAYTTAMTSVVTANSATTEAKPLADGVKDLTSNGVKDPKAYNTVLSNIEKIAFDDKTSDEMFSITIDNTFGEGNVEFLKQFQEGDRLKVYERFTSPEWTMKVQQRAKTNPELWNQYRSWASTQFKVLFDEKAEDIQADFDFADGQAQVVFNEDTMQFDLDMKESIGTDAWGRPNGQLTEFTLSENINDLNRYLRNFTPILMAQEGDPTHEIGMMMSALGLSFEIDQDGSQDNTTTPRSAFEQTLEVQTPSGVQEAVSQGADDRTLLDSLGASEGADYNTMFGGGTAALTTSTVEDIRTMQGSKVNTPMGKYQIKASTLQGLIDQGVLDKDELFDEEAQDRAAMALLRQRGLDKWKAGKMSREQFLKNLSMEWASVPTEVGGLSYYQEDGVNHATEAGQALARLIAGG